MRPETALISEDCPEPVRVPVVYGLFTMPYYSSDQAYQFHADGCDQCSGDSPLPCPVGGALGDDFWTALERQRSAARQN